VHLQSLDLSDYLSLEVLCNIECIVMTLKRSFPMSLARIGLGKQSSVGVCVLSLTFRNAVSSRTIRIRCSFENAGNVVVLTEQVVSNQRIVT